MSEKVVAGPPGARNAHSLSRLNSNRPMLHSLSYGYSRVNISSMFMSMRVFYQSKNREGIPQNL